MNDARPKNLCRHCSEDFNSVELFDAHRVGRHEVDWSPEQEDGRRCLDGAEMEDLGWRLDPVGRWFDPRRLERTPRDFANRSKTLAERAGALESGQDEEQAA